jgi:hypothetical protein
MVLILIFLQFIKRLLQEKIGWLKNPLCDRQQVHVDWHSVHDDRQQSPVD